MNTNFNPSTHIQTYLQEVPAHPIHGPKHWRVVGRSLAKDGSDVTLGTGPTIAEATIAANAKVAEEYPGFSL